MRVKDKIKSCILSCETIEQVETCLQWCDRAIHDLGDKIDLHSIGVRQEDKVYRYAPVKKFEKEVQHLYLGY